MPWASADAQRHTKKADTPEKQKKWATIANNVLKVTGNEGRAIRIANAGVANNPHPHKKK